MNEYAYGEYDSPSCSRMTLVNRVVNTSVTTSVLARNAPSTAGTVLVNSSVSVDVSPVPANTSWRTTPAGGGSSTSTHCSRVPSPGSVPMYLEARSTSW